MDYTKATNKQLWNIISSDIDCPTDLMSGVVHEVIERQGFHFLIKHLINRMFTRYSRLRRFHYYDLYQVGYIGVVNALRSYQPGKASFKTFAFMMIRTEFDHLLAKDNSEKRKVYDGIISMDVQKHDENEESFVDNLIDEYQQVEQQVIKKDEWEYHMNKLDERERNIIELFCQGYTFNEMAEGIFEGLRHAASVTKVFHGAIQKINPEIEGRLNLRQLGITTRRKEVGA